MIFSKGTLLAASLSLLSVAAAVPAAAPAEYQQGDVMLVVRDAKPGRHDYYDDDELPRLLRQKRDYAFCSAYLNLKTKTFTWYGRPVKTTTVDLQTMTNTVVSVTTSPAPIETVFPTVTETTVTETSLVPATITTTETPIFTATCTSTAFNFITTGAPAAGSKRDLEARRVWVPNYLRNRNPRSISKACSRIVTAPTVTVTIRPTQTRTVKLTTTVVTVQLTGVAADSTITTSLPTTLTESLTSTITPEPVTTIVEAATTTITEIASASATLHPCDPATWIYNLSTFGYRPTLGGRASNIYDLTPQECCARCYDQSSGGCNLWGFTPGSGSSTCHIFYGSVEDSSECKKSELCPRGIGRAVILPGGGGTRMAGLGPCNMGVSTS